MSEKNDNKRNKRKRYYHISYYNSKLNTLKKLKQSFILTRTSYTKRIETEAEIMFFNDSGDEDKLPLILINSVRKDAKKYIEQHTINGKFEIDENCDFFNLLDIIENDDVIVKVDLKSAYWEFALKEGVITQKTNEKFQDLYKDVDAFFSKQARLKALGSLATSKHTSYYKNGKYNREDPPDIQATKKVYMKICDGVDRLMKDTNYHVDGCVYYYWDCIFVKKEYSQDAIDYLNGRGYDVSTQETKLEYIKIGDIGYLLSTSDDKIYMTRNENRFLLDFDDED